MKKFISIITPTYNEEGNIEKLCLEISKEIGVSSQVLSYHIRSLIKWEMIERKRTGLKNSLYITELGIEALTKDL